MVGHSTRSLLTDLRNKAKTCEFGALRDTLIRDRIVCGIDSNTVRERLLRNTDLGLEDAIAAVRAAESSKTQLQKLNVPDRQVDALGKRQQNETDNKAKNNSKPGEPCRRCGTLHEKGKCIAYGKTCNKCHGENHFAKMCFTKSPSRRHRTGNSIGKRTEFR